MINKMTKNTIKSRNRIKSRKEIKRSREKDFCKYCGEELNLGYAATMDNLINYVNRKCRYFRIPKEDKKNICPHCGALKK
ncbi:hypothetical protein J4413_01430 [Candidatus Woesearchaeota archaeon]|nr:hypothetical protein [Candidatus Woesearchaeota archaeon]